jgi:hypothetical protein
VRPPDAQEPDPQIVAAALEIAGWLAASKAVGYGNYDALPKFIVTAGERRTLEIPRLEISLVLPPDRDLPRYRPHPRRHATRPQRDLVVQHWVYASTADATTSVAVARLESGAENEWTAHISRGPLTQFIDRFDVPVAPGLASNVAPRAAHIALIIADVLMPLQAELERIHGRRIPE